MAKLSLSDQAPNEEVTFSIGSLPNFTIAPGGTFETDDDVLIAGAVSTGIVSVEYSEKDIMEPTAPLVGRIAPEDDPLTHEGQIVDPNSPDEIRKAEAAKAEVPEGSVAPAVVPDAPQVVETVAPSRKFPTATPSTDDGDSN